MIAYYILFYNFAFAPRHLLQKQQQTSNRIKISKRADDGN